MPASVKSRTSNVPVTDHPKTHRETPVALAVLLLHPMQQRLLAFGKQRKGRAFMG